MIQQTNHKKLMSVKDLKKELFKDKSFKKYFKKNELSHEIAVSVMEARISKGMSQEDLAKKAKTKQPSIARLEKGSYLPSLRFLEKIAKALGTELIPPKFKFLEDTSKSANASYELTERYYLDYPVRKTSSILRDRINFEIK
jgi:ribosome-binding protein aMBF1 (putative translation factor)